VRPVHVLFARRRSVYFDLGVEVYDIERDARTFSGGGAVVAHPPCRAWGRLRGLAKPRPLEKRLAVWAVHQVRQFGGVLEHPEASSLWPHLDLPRPGCGADRFGGWTMGVDQSWFGHPSRKRTLLYVVGVSASKVPPFPLLFPSPDLRDVSNLCAAGREKTPRSFARWLIDLAASTAPLPPSVIEQEDYGRFLSGSSA
jgi:hypothetical protein